MGGGTGTWGRGWAQKPKEGGPRSEALTPIEGPPRHKDVVSRGGDAPEAGLWEGFMYITEQTLFIYLAAEFQHLRFQANYVQKLFVLLWTSLFFAGGLSGPEGGFSEPSLGWHPGPPHIQRHSDVQVPSLRVIQGLQEPTKRRGTHRNSLRAPFGTEGRSQAQRGPGQGRSRRQTQESVSETAQVCEGGAGRTAWQAHI